MVKPRPQMDCYIIASTLREGGGYSNYKKKDGLSKEEEEDDDEPTGGPRDGTDGGRQIITVSMLARRQR